LRGDEPAGIGVKCAPIDEACESMGERGEGRGKRVTSDKEFVIVFEEKRPV